MSASTDVVLIPGAWMGAWAWDDVAAHLRTLGHRPHTLTLTGLDGTGDPSAITLDTHVADVVDLIESRDLRDAVVVGHSYSSLVAALVAHNLPDRVAHTLYVAAFLPHDGESLVDLFSDEQAADERRQIEQNGGRWPPPTAGGLAHEADLTDAQRQRLVDGFVAHPGRTVTEPVTFPGSLATQSATYVACTLEQSEIPSAVADLKDEPTWALHRIAAGHFPMLSAPDDLADTLVPAVSGIRAA